ADVADHLALRHALAALEPDGARHVRIQRGVPLAVVEHDGVAIATMPARRHHARVTGGHDRRAAARGVVHALVHARGAQYRVAAVAEARAQPRVLDRAADETLLQRPAFGGEVLALAVALEAHRGERLALGGEHGRGHWTAADQLAFAPGLLDDDAEAVAGGDVAVEVDVVLEDVVGEGIDHRGAQPELARGMEQRLADLAADHRGAYFDRPLDHLLHDLVAGQRQFDPLGVAAVVAERDQAAVGGVVE